MDYKIDSSRITRSGVLTKIDVRLFVKGARNVVGFGVGYVPRGDSARQEFEGEMVPGPWLYSYGKPAIIDMHGGSRAEIDREKAAGAVIEAEPGDRLIVEGDAYRIGFLPGGHGEHLTLTKEPV
jgi:hypothetical protein